jgi:uncharacterized membrane protein
MMARETRHSDEGMPAPGGVERTIAHVLFWGGLLSIGLVLIGLALYAAHGGFAGHTLELRQLSASGRDAHPPAVFVSLSEVVRGLRARPVDPLAVIALGVVLLLMTPVAGVTLAIPSFLVAADHRYATIAAIVFLMLAVSVLLAGGAG